MSQIDSAVGTEPAVRPAPASLAGSTRAPTLAPGDVEGLVAAARRIRVRAVRMIAPMGLGYLGQALSSAELFAVLYRSVLRHGVDRFVLSPGHYVIAHYAAAVEAGLLDEDALAAYGADGSWLETISTERTPLVSATCGALGQGLSVAVGFALAARLDAEKRRTYAFVSDGELEEGQTWEAAMFAAHHKLGSLTVLLDCNNSQVDGPVDHVTTIEPIVGKWASFGWHAVECDGHDVSAIGAALTSAADDERPSVLVARTRATAGIPSLGATRDAHFIKLSPEAAEAALADLAAGFAIRAAGEGAPR